MEEANDHMNEEPNVQPESGRAAKRARPDIHVSEAAIDIGPVAVAQESRSLLSFEFASTSSAVVPICPDSVRAFTEPAALSRAEELLAIALAAADVDAHGRGLQLQLAFKRDVNLHTHDVDNGRQLSGAIAHSLRLSSRFRDGSVVNASLYVQRRDGIAASGGARGIVCTAAACTADACCASLGLCPHAAACLLHLATHPELLDTDEQLPQCYPSPALDRLNQLSERLAARAISAELAAFDRTRQPMWRCTTQGCKQSKEEPYVAPKSVMKTLKPHSNLGQGRYDVNLQPEFGARLLERPAFYSQLCGHRLREEDMQLDGGESSCFVGLLARVNAFAQRLRAAGHPLAAAGVLLQLAASLARYTGDATFLQAYNTVDGTYGVRKENINEARERLVDTMTGLCLVAVDDRLDREARTALGGRALSAAGGLFPTDAPRKLRTDDRAFFNVRSLLMHEGPIALWYHDFDSDAPILLLAARALVRAARMAESSASGPASPFVSFASAPFLDVQACCRYLLERGRFQDCLDLSRSLGDVSTLAAAAQQLAIGGRPGPEDAVSAALSVVDRLLPFFFGEEFSWTPLARCRCDQLRSTAACTCSPLESLLQRASSSGRSRRGVGASYRCEASPAAAHSFLTTCDQCSTRLHSAVTTRETYVALVGGLRTLLEQRLAANDRLSFVWLKVALASFVGIRWDRSSRLPSRSVDRNSIIAFVVHSGLALRASVASTSPPFVQRDSRSASAEALRIARLPLAQAHAACAEQPGEALEAALARLAMMGLLPSRGLRSNLVLDLGASQSMRLAAAAAAGHADVDIGALVARFYLHNTSHALRPSTLYSHYEHERLELRCHKTPELELFYRVGYELFGPVGPGTAAAAASKDGSPGRVREVALSLLAARSGGGRSLSVLGECEPLPAQRYETLLVACVLRLVALACHDDALRLVVALLELEDDEAAARRRFFATVLFRRDFLYARDHFLEGEYEESLHAPLVAVVSMPALQLCVGSAAWKHALGHASALDLYNAAFEILSMCGGAGTVNASAMKCIFAGLPWPYAQNVPVPIQVVEIFVAAEAVAAASRSGDGFLAELSLSLLAATGEALDGPPLGDAWTFYRPALCDGRVDSLFHSAIFLEASGQLEAAASLAVACLFRYDFHHGAFVGSLNLLDRVAPQISDGMGLSVQTVGVQGLRRRVVERCLERYGCKEDLEQAAADRQSNDTALGERLQQHLLLLRNFVAYRSEGSRSVSPFVDYHLAARIAGAFLRPKAVRAFFGQRMRLSSLTMWRLILGEVGELLQRGGSTGEERAGALQLAERVWDVCPCVQAASVVRGAHLAAGSSERWESWLKEQLEEIRNNRSLVLTKTLHLQSEDDETDDEHDESDHELAVRLTLAAVALYLSDDDDAFNVEGSLGLDLSARPSGVVSMITLFARWRQVAELAGMSEDFWAGRGGADAWRGTATLARAAARLDRFGGRAGLLLQQLYADVGRGPDGRDAAAVEDGACSAEQLEEVCDSMLDHQEEYMRGVDAGVHKPHGCDRPEACQLCREAWYIDDSPWRLHSLHLLAPPLLQMDADRAESFYSTTFRDTVASYIVGRLTSIARVSSSTARSSEEVHAAASAAAHKVYLAATTVCEELRMMVGLDPSLGLAHHPAIDHLRSLRLPICEAFLSSAAESSSRSVADSLSPPSVEFEPSEPEADDETYEPSEPEPEADDETA